MSQSNEVRYTARSITPPDRDRDSGSKSPPPRRRAASKSPPLPPPPPFPPKGVRTISKPRSPSPTRHRSVSRSPPPKRRHSTSRSPPPKRRHSTSRSPPPKRRGRSRSRSRSRSRNRSRSRSRSRDDVRNPGNNLYVTGLSTRTKETDLEKFFSKEGKVKDCRVVMDPRLKESRGFAFVTMENVEDARRCIKYLHRTVLEGRLISVAKAKRTRERTPTPGEYCGPRGGRARVRSRSPPGVSSRGSRDHSSKDRRSKDRSRSPGGRRDRDRDRDSRKRD